jgi:hypothetical protein
MRSDNQQIKGLKPIHHLQRDVTIYCVLGYSLEVVSFGRLPITGYRNN